MYYIPTCDRKVWPPRCIIFFFLFFSFFFFFGGWGRRGGGGREELLALLWLMIYGHCQQLFYTKRLVEFCHNICIACSCDGFLKIPREAGANVIFNCGVTFLFFTSQPEMVHFTGTVMLQCCDVLAIGQNNECPWQLYLSRSWSVSDKQNMKLSRRLESQW